MALSKEEILQAIEEMKVIELHELVEAIKEKLIPCVIIGRPDINLPFSTIDVDNVHLVEEVVSEMKESGRNNI